MSEVSVEISAVSTATKKCQVAQTELMDVSNKMIRNYNSLGSDWNDEKYRELGAIVRSCSDALRQPVSELQRCERFLQRIYNSLAEYQNIHFTGNGSSNGSQPSSSASSTAGGSSTSSSVHIQGPAELKHWLVEINPNYRSPFYPPSSSSPYKVNCGSCALAVEQRLSGNDSIAIASCDNIPQDRDMERITGRTCRYMSVAKIEAILRERGPGSHLIVGINRRRTIWGCRRAGHWFNVYYDGENFFTLDGQSGSVYEWPYDYGHVSAWCALV